MCGRINTQTDVYLLVDCDVNTDRRQEQWELAYYLASSLYPNTDSNAVRLFVFSTGHVNGQGQATLVHDPTRYSSVDEALILSNIYTFRTCSATKRTSLSAGINAISRSASEKSRNYIVAIITGRPNNELDSASALSNSLLTLVDPLDRSIRIRPVIFYNDVTISETLQQIQGQVEYLWFYPVRTRQSDIANSLCEQLPVSTGLTPRPPVPTPAPGLPPTATSGKILYEKTLRLFARLHVE